MILNDSNASAKRPPHPPNTAIPCIIFGKKPTKNKFLNNFRAEFPRDHTNRTKTRKWLVDQFPATGLTPAQNGPSKARQASSNASAKCLRDGTNATSGQPRIVGKRTLGLTGPLCISARPGNQRQLPQSHEGECPPPVSLRYSLSAAASFDSLNSGPAGKY